MCLLLTTLFGINEIEELIMFTKIKRLYKIIRIKSKTNHVYIAKNANFSYRTIFEGYNKVGKNSWLDGKIGIGSYIGENSLIEGSVGRYCSISHKVTVLTGNHPSHKFVSTSPSFFSVSGQNGKIFVSENKFEEKKYADINNKYGIIVGNDVWIGYGATIIGGVKIGDGAIIGANAFVNSDVEPYSIMVGQPAKKIGYRFNQRQIEMLETIKWWNKSDKWLDDHCDYFQDIDYFLNRVHKDEK